MFKLRPYQCLLHISTLQVNLTFKKSFLKFFGLYCDVHQSSLVDFGSDGLFCTTILYYGIFFYIFKFLFNKIPLKIFFFVCFIQSMSCSTVHSLMCCTTEGEFDKNVGILDLLKLTSALKATFANHVNKCEPR